MKRGTTTFLKLCIFIIGVIVLLLCMFWLPWVANSASELNPEYAYLKFPALIGLYMTTIPFYLALYQALKLLGFIEKNNAFSEHAVISLKHIKHYAIAIIAFYIIGVVGLLTQNALHPGIAIMGIAIVFASFMISLFAAVLQELLRNALQIKSENELTI